jgi:glycosyltransferase involved in cell wall biosynthesis
MRIFFYPHSYLRDRQLDTIRRWPFDQVVNPEVAENRHGNQVNSAYANATKLQVLWKQKLPLLNVKLRPRETPRDAIVYVWGAVVATGRFIVDLDNPWSLVGYNLRAMPVYRFLIKQILLSKRCLEIRCMSEACRLSLKALFGDGIYNKATVHYPYMPQFVTEIPARLTDECRFLFVGTQFEIKGGVALFKAFRRVHAQAKNARLDVITHLPVEYAYLADECPGIHIHEAKFTRIEIYENFMCKADVVVLPTYVESFGMVALEALAHGLALIVTDVYALRELVRCGRNGRLLPPPISVWDGVWPSRYYYHLENIKFSIRSADTSKFEEELFCAMLEFALDPKHVTNARIESTKIMKEKFDIYVKNHIR